MSSPLGAGLNPSESILALASVIDKAGVAGRLGGGGVISTRSESLLTSSIPSWKSMETPPGNAALRIRERIRRIGTRKNQEQADDRDWPDEHSCEFEYELRHFHEQRLPKRRLSKKLDAGRYVRAEIVPS